MAQVVEKTKKSGETADVEMFHETPLKEGVDDGTSRGTLGRDTWRWTKKKRRAVKLVVRGLTDIKIGEELGVHRKTIKRWKDTAEFRAAVVTEANEYTQRTRFKRVFESGVFADQFGKQLAKTFSRIDKQAGDLSQQQLNALQTLTRGYGEFREHERSDFGDNVKRIEGNFTFAGALGGTDPSAGAAGAQSFKRFVEDNIDKIPQGVIAGGRNSGEALVLAARVLVQETDILDKLHEEDKAAFDKERADK